MKSSSSINVSGGRRSSGSSAPFAEINIGQSQMGGGSVSSSGWTADTAILVEEDEDEESEGEERSGDDSHEQQEWEESQDDWSRWGSHVPNLAFSQSAEEEPTLGLAMARRAEESGLITHSETAREVAAGEGKADPKQPGRRASVRLSGQLKNSTGQMGDTNPMSRSHEVFYAEADKQIRTRKRLSSSGKEVDGAHETTRQDGQEWNLSRDSGDMTNLERDGDSSGHISTGDNTVYERSESPSHLRRGRSVHGASFANPEAMIQRAAEVLGSKGRSSHDISVSSLKGKQSGTNTPASPDASTGSGAGQTESKRSQLGNESKGDIPVSFSSCALDSPKSPDLRKDDDLAGRVESREGGQQDATPARQPRVRGRQPLGNEGGSLKRGNTLHMDLEGQRGNLDASPAILATMGVQERVSRPLVEEDFYASSPPLNQEDKNREREREAERNREWQEKATVGRQKEMIGVLMSEEDQIMSSRWARQVSNPDWLYADYADQRVAMAEEEQRMTRGLTQDGEDKVYAQLWTWKVS